MPLAQRGRMGRVRKAPRYGRWEARCRDPYGTQRTRMFVKKGEATAFLAVTETDVSRGHLRFYWWAILVSNQ